jgi:hypothetical protein
MMKKNIIGIAVLAMVFVTGVVPLVAQSADSFEVALTNDGSVRITKFLGKDKNVVIPATIQGMKVTEIGERAFAGALLNKPPLTSLVIPEGVKVIGAEAFSFCSNLTTVSLPSTLTTIGNEAFNNCSKLKSITIPDSVTKVGNGLFRYCSALTTVKLPSGLKVIPTQMFQSTGLATFEIPEGITTIQAEAFGDCKNLTGITLPSTIGAFTVGPSQQSNPAFKDCVNLTKVTIPDSVTKISFIGWDFKGCKKLDLASQAALKKRGWDGKFDWG